MVLVSIEMKRLVIFIALLISVTASYSATFEGTGKVAFIRAFDSSLPATDWIGVEGFTSAGSCPILNGYVVLMMRADSQGDRLLSMALSARMAGKTVRVGVDESLTAGGYCLIWYMDILED